MIERALFMIRSLSAAVLVVLPAIPAVAMAADLVLYLEKREAVLHVRAASAFDTSEFSIEPQAGIIQKLVQIYDRIERRQEKAGTLDKVGSFMGKQYQAIRGLMPFGKDDKQKPEEQAEPQAGESLERLLSDAGALLFGPIETQVAIARRIELVVSEECLFYPFDALHVDGAPLFLKKPVSYSLNVKTTSTVRASSSWRGLIIGDAVTDPVKGTATVTSYFPGAFEFDAQRIRQEDIAGISSADFILVSADGGVDGLKMKQLVLRAESLSRLKPELVYIDCNLYGMNLNFINHFIQSGVSTYVAPIFSRQTGEASAQTMTRFFRTLLKGEDPSRALYLARKTIYDSAILKGEDKLTAVRQAFPFRVYQLN